MFSRRIVTRTFRTARAKFSTAITEKPSTPQPAPVAVKSPSAAPPTSGGSTFFQRFASFLTGCGVGFGVSFYYIYTELLDSNEKFDRELKDLRAQLQNK